MRVGRVFQHLLFKCVTSEGCNAIQFGELNSDETAEVINRRIFYVLCISLFELLQCDSVINQCCRMA